MLSWHPYPFFRFIIPFAIGILMAIFIDFPFESGKTILLISTVLTFVPVALHYFISTFRYRWLSGVSVYVFLLFAGCSLTVFHTPKYDRNNISNLDADVEISILRILEPLTEKAKSRKTVGKLLGGFDSVGFIPASGNILIYLEKDSLSAKLCYGDEIAVRSKISLVEAPGNPHQFDYKRFLANSGIYHQVFIKHDDWVKTGESWTNPVFLFAYAARDKMLNILRDVGLQGDEYAVVSAILLGYDDLMGRELRDKYSGAGALHVLCVSGLHVGIIFLLLSFLLKPLNRKKKLRILKVILLLVSIWAYAFITGLSPSVMRAAIMFSLFAWREVRKDKSNPYNILAASAFILLAIDPYMITKIGFQLSYAAVIAIISLFQPIYNLMPVKNRILDYFWKLTVVSLAAQIGTFPFAIFYFHQFPVYFFLTNILVIPLVWLILNTGILVLFISVFSSFLATKLSYLLYLLLLGLNTSVDFINALPGATIHGLVLSFLQVCIIYILIVSLGRALLSKSARLLLLSVASMVILLMSFVLTKIDILHQKEVVIYQVNGHSGMEFIQGQRSLFIADSALLSNQQMLDFNISSNRIFSGIKHVDELTMGSKTFESEMQTGTMVQFHTPGFYGFGKIRMAVVDENFGIYKPGRPISVDVLILLGNPKIQISELKSKFIFEHLVFDASNPYWAVNKWKAQCDSSSVTYHDVKNRGYFKIGL